MAKRKKKRRATAHSSSPAIRMTAQELEGFNNIYKSGVKALERSDFANAERYFKQALNILIVPEPLQGLGTLYIQQERFEEGEPIFEQLVKMEPREAYFWYCLGICAFKNYWIGEAWNALSKAKRLYRGEDKELGEAITDLFEQVERSFALQSEEHPALDRKTHLQQERRYREAAKFQDKKEFVKALKTYESYLKIEPTYYRVLGNVGSCLIGLGLHDDAEVMLRRALAVNPDYDPAKFNLARLPGYRQLPEGLAPNLLTVHHGGKDSFEEQVSKQIEIANRTATIAQARYNKTALLKIVKRILKLSTLPTNSLTDESTNL